MEKRYLEGNGGRSVIQKSGNGSRMTFHQKTTLLIILLVIIIIAFPKYRFKSYHGGVGKVLYVTRWVRTYPGLITVLGTLSIVYVGIRAELREIVIVTLFYGTILFFGQILRRGGPFPILEFDTQYKNSDFGDSDDLGCQYEFGLKNVGQGPLIGASIEYKVYDSEYGICTKSWLDHPKTARQEFALDPGEIEEVTIDVDHVTVGEEPDYYLAVRVVPRPQFRDLTLWWTTPIGTSERTQE